jgi:hypothetical protein
LTTEILWCILKKIVFVSYLTEGAIMQKGMVVLRILIAGAAGTLPIYVFCRMLNANNFASVILDGIYLLAALYLFGLTAAALFSSPAAWCLVDFLLYPKRFLKSAPPILSRQQGLIARKRFEEAEQELQELRRNYKGSPEIALMLAELHALEFHDPEVAVADCHYYFQHRSWRYCELNLPILLRYADWQNQLGRPEEACIRLLGEAKSSFYPEGEKKILRARAASLRQQCSEK